jgi:carboxypeptidase Taq
MSRTDDLYLELTRLLRETAVLSSCSNVLGWDEQTFMPEGGAQFRSEQLGLLAGMTHERATSPRVRSGCQCSRSSPQL